MPFQALLISLTLLEPNESAFEEYVSEPGAFRVLLPGKPEEIDIPSRDGKPPGYQLTLDGYEGAYLVFFSDDPELSGMDSRARQRYLNASVNELAREVGGRIASKRLALLDDQYLGLSCEMELSDPAGWFRARLFLVDERLYRLTAVGYGDFARSDDAETFLTSFRLVPRGEGVPRSNRVPERGAHATPVPWSRAPNR
jgi:hypothetical protein